MAATKTQRPQSLESEKILDDVKLSFFCVQVVLLLVCSIEAYLKDQNAVKHQKV